MKILMYLTYFPPHYSGASKQAIALANHLRKQGHYIEFITLHRGDEAEHCLHDGFRVSRIREGQGRHKEFVFWLNFIRFAFNRRKDFDILHSHGAYYYNSFVGPLSRLLGKKSLVKTSLANNDLAYVGSGISGRLHLFFLNQIDAYVAISADLLEEFKNLNFPASKTHFLPNGVDTQRFCPLPAGSKPRKRTALGLDPECKIALTIGVFDRRKNIGWLIDEWIRQPASGSQALLLAIGPQSRDDPDGTFLNSLQVKANQNPEKVRILSHVDNIEEYFQIADYFVLPSTNEGMPNVVLEAMAAGLPCLATRISGCEDLIQDGVNGYLFAPDDAADFSRAQQRLMAAELNELGHAARRMVEEQYSLSALAEKYQALYERLLK